MDAWFISDIHLKDINERNSLKLLRFLSLLETGSHKCTHLVLLGDIFDLWIGSGDYFQVKFQSLIDALVRLKRRGIEIVYFEGNHDVHIKEFWQKKLKIPVFTEEKYLELGPWTVRMEHGDFINPEDKAYLKMREVIRTPALEKLANVMPAKVWDRVGNFASQLSRMRSSAQRAQNESEFRSMIRKYAESSYEKGRFDYIITGHMHIRDEYQFERSAKKITSINLGSWFEETQALHLNDKGHQWLDLD
ncbi:MAG: UDP-2,3-diacylglucosamine diphosphatase [Proteobacteria bacterium]|jgi:UDP-2,3-diacylglucosamine hydrolase|nr:UDP-2,3-diacylglucosamine diphosphatase [Pseudomonadota bacterium]